MVYRFDDFSLDLSRRELKRAGEGVTVEPLVLDVLECLIRNRHRVVSKDELVAQVWGRRIVSDSTVSSRIAIVRSALGDSGKAQRLIRTVSRRGFRFIGAVQEERDPAETAAAPADPMAICADQPAIAVLAFAQCPSEQAQQTFANGLAEDIATALGRLPWLSVIARSSSLLHQGWALDIRHVGRSLGARYVLEGSVRTALSRVRVTGRLVEAATGISLWSDQMDLWDEDLFSLQDRVTGRIVGMVQQRLLRLEIDRAVAEQAGGPTARQCHLQGLGRLYKWSKDGISDALGLFRQAIEIDPEYAPAYAMSAYCYIQRKSYGWIEDRDGETAECTRLARRAAELARNDASVLATAGHALASVSRDVDSAAVLLDEALRRDPKLGLAWYVSGWVRLMLGQADTATQHLVRAIELSPFDPLLTKMQAALAYAHFFLRRYDEAALSATQALRTRPSYLTAVRGAAAGHAFAGRLGDARALIAFMHERDPDLRMANLAQLIPMSASHLDQFADAMHRAGLPD